jgi:hypothetical protein
MPSTYHREKTPKRELVSGDLIVTSVQGRPSSNEYAIGLIGSFLAASDTHGVLYFPTAFRA